MLHEYTVSYLSRALLLNSKIVTGVFRLQIASQPASVQVYIVHVSAHSLGINSPGQNSEIKQCEHLKDRLASMQELPIYTPPPGGGECSFATVLAQGGYFRSF